MSINEESVPVVTDAAGNDLSTVRAGGCIIRKVRVEVGTLAATTDIVITEEPGAHPILTLTNVAADVDKVPTQLGQDAVGVDVAGSAMPVGVFSRIQVAIAQGGNTKTGRVVLLLER